MDNCLIVGGGVVGLSLAYVLAGEGARVRVLDAGDPGHESSWAGAGILPPGAPRSHDPNEQLSALSNRLHAEWAPKLRDETGLDNEYRTTGGVYLARDAIEADALAAQSALWRSGGVEVVDVLPRELADYEPALRPEPPVLAARLLPQEAQLRNPRHLKALIAACRALGVAIEGRQEVVDFVAARNRVEAVVTPCGRFAAETFCLAAGCWSAVVARRLGFAPAIKPVRGQIVLLAGDASPSRVVNEGKRYLVPRGDGRVLVGSTEEDVGFDRRATPEVRDDLLAFAASLAPALGALRMERNWAGLRPGTADGCPYIGRIPSWDNVFISAGHFRHGLQWSTGSAVIVARLMRGQGSPFDLGPFDPARGGGCPIGGADAS